MFRYTCIFTFTCNYASELFKPVEMIKKKKGGAIVIKL